jgi:MSHA biogenesis protein MshJ
MREVLSQLLRSDESIKVTDFTSLPAEKVNVDGVTVDTDIIIYQHGLLLTVQGGYYDLQRYMKRLEALPWQFYWKTFAYTVLEYPNAKLEIEITTISTNERFIAI